MYSIKSFNKQLNQSSSNKYEKWTNYRNQLTAEIISAFEDKTGDMLIIGAGNSNDIDLTRIKDVCDKLYVSDVDDQALSSALQTYELNTDDVKSLTVEYTGLSSLVNWQAFLESVSKIKRDSGVRKLMKSYKNIISNHVFMESYDHQFDKIIVSPIYTQLLFQQINMELKALEDIRYNMHFITLLRDSFLNLMTNVINQFNDNILKLLSPQGKVFVISDIYQTKNDSDFMDEIKIIINDNDKMELLYKKYRKQYGTGLGDYGLHNMAKKLKPHDIRWMIWPFSEETTMVVKLVLYQKINTSAY